MNNNKNYKQSVCLRGLRYVVMLVFIFPGQVKTLAGGGREGFKDGVGKEARFNYPEGLYFDTDHGILYVVEFVSIPKLMYLQVMKFVGGHFHQFNAILMCSQK